MSLYWHDAHRTLYNGNCRAMTELADDSIQCCVTSPPYWGLRKYAGEQDSIWGGSLDCPHEWVDSSIPKSGGVGDYEVGRVGNAAARADCHDKKESNTCSLCGAWRGAYGLEPTVEMYVSHSIEILREIRRVLRKDGVCFWNLGDSYIGGKGQSGSESQEYQDERRKKGLSITKVQQVGGPGQTSPKDDMKSLRASNLKPKDLALIPFRVAIASQSDGWYVRSVIIWNKPNPMPESVTDRPTESHEYIIMLTKSSRYYWDMEAVREPQLQQSIDRMTRNHSVDYNPGYPTQGPQNLHFGEKLSKEDAECLGGRNLRSVWTFPTHGYAGAHFATFPEKLPELCIKAATPEEGCCGKCGTPWERIVEVTRNQTNKKYRDWSDLASIGTHQKTGNPIQCTNPEAPETKTLGWQPICKCHDAIAVPSTVLDPFCGAGTTLKVAAELNRHAAGYEISKEYCELIVNRNKQGVIL